MTFQKPNQVSLVLIQICTFSHRQHVSNLNYQLPYKPRRNYDTDLPLSYLL